MKPLMKGIATLAVTAAIAAAFAGAAYYAASGGEVRPYFDPSARPPNAAGAQGAQGSAAASGFQPDQGPQREVVAGWNIAQSDDGFQDDPRYRIVELEHRVGRQRMEYVRRILALVARPLERLLFGIVGQCRRLLLDRGRRRVAGGLAGADRAGAGHPRS